MDNNHGVRIEGSMPSKLEAFSAKNVIFNEKDTLDFSQCNDLSFLSYN